MARDEAAAERAQAAAFWSGGDYRQIAEILAPTARVLIDSLGRLDRHRLLDVAAGTGNVAVVAAERGAHVVASDLSPRMVELGRAHTPATVEWREADACDLPFDDADFDIVTSAFGLMFAEPEAAVAEAARVLRPGGRLALTAWDPDGFMGFLNDKQRPWMAPPPDAADPMDWGRPHVVKARLRSQFDPIEIATQDLPWHLESTAAARRLFEEASPAHVAMGSRLRPAEASALFDAIEAAHASVTDATGRVVADARYLVIIAERTA